MPSLEWLIQRARDLGAHAARSAPAADVPVTDEAPDWCARPLCPNHAKSPHCPPYALKPAAFRDRLKDFRLALVFKIDVPVRVFLSGQSRPAFRKIFEIAAELEGLGPQAGFSRAQGYAAGSCFEVLCGGEACLALEAPGACRHPNLARPSMEAVGVHVFDLVQSLEWEIKRIGANTDPETDGLLAGMVLLG